MHDTSEDEFDSDAGLDNDMDDEEEEEGYESVDDVPEDESHGAEEDLTAENGAPLNVDSLGFSLVIKLLTFFKHSIRPSALGRSATEPSPHTTIPRRATFPNLPGFAIPPAPNLEPKPPQTESSKRKVETEATDSESRTSSHLSKRRKYSAELSETFNPGSADPPAPMKALIDNMNQNGMIFYPEAIAQAEENYRKFCLAYTAEKTSRQETYEAALKRATRRANDAERKLQDASQDYADKIKVNDEIHAKVVEALREEVANLTASLKSSNESLKTATESTSLRTALSEKEAQLARHDELQSQFVSKFESLSKSHIKATKTVSALKTQQEKASKFIDESFQDWGDVTFNKLQKFASDMKYDTHIMKGLVVEELEEWEKIGNITDWLMKAVAPATDAEKADAVAEKTTIALVTTATAMAMTEDAPVEQQQQQQQASVGS